MAKKVEGSDSETRSAHAAEAKANGVGEKQIYLRTVYPLNPGIPHSVDFPNGWRRD